MASERAKQLAAQIMDHVHRQITRPEMELSITPLIQEYGERVRRETIEECAKVADRMSNNVYGSYPEANTARYYSDTIAEFIRDLAADGDTGRGCTGGGNGK